MSELQNFCNEVIELLKEGAKKEYAPGIPSKKTSHELPSIKKPTTWEFGVHKHDALRRGLHFDLRLGDPSTGRAHSWALPAEWPKPGDVMWAIQQPTHTVEYMDFEGTLPPGYGAGKVSLFDRNKTEVTKAEPGYISFNVYRGSGPEEYSLRRIDGKKWILANKTLNRDAHQLPEYKPKYKEISVNKIPFEDTSYIMSAKIDDAHNLFYLPESGKQIRIVSYRPSKKNDTGLIEHTHKVEKVFGKLTPKGLGGTILRGGLYAMHPDTDKATDAAVLAGMLNSDVWKSREKQEEHGQLVPILYDVEKYRGRDVSKVPYAQKLKIIREVQKAVPNTFELPQMAYTAKEKKELLDLIKNKKLAHTEEGVVLWNALESEPAIKAKFAIDHDVFIRGFFPGEGKYKGEGVGGFVYSHTKTGPIVGKVGTGLSDSQRKDMHKNPEKYVGLVAVVQSRGKYDKTHALRAPAFKSFHADKNDQARLDKIELDDGK